MKLCILDKDTRVCVNIMSQEFADAWVDHANLIRAPRDDGEIGWVLLPDGSWDTGYRPPSPEDLAAAARARRDKFLQRYIDEINAVRWASMTELQQQAWIAYRQALLDVPEQPGFPTDISWPEPPINNE